MFISRFFGTDLTIMTKDYIRYKSPFMLNIIRTCCEQGTRAFFNEKMPDGSVVHSFSRKLGINPVTGDTAVAIGVLSISDPGNGESYADIARALASDYHKIYVVDLDNEEYIEYSSPAGMDELAIKRHGTGFFEKAVSDSSQAMLLISV
jgi:hypothetical protein